MVEFVTLLLGALVAGPTEVRLEVHRDVAAVELLLDGTAVGTLRAAPWRAEVDFGAELAPHLLEAVAYSPERGEVGRASQWVNLNPRESEVTIALDRDLRSGRVMARVGWQSLAEDNRPLAVRALFDGEPLEVRDPAAIVLPPHTADRVHHLGLELEFAGGVRASAEVTFGGQYGDSISSELTAFPVVLGGRDELPEPEAMRGWFRSGERPLRVHGADRGVAEIVVVRSSEARTRLYRMQRRRAPAPGFATLDSDQRLRFLGASPQLVGGGAEPFVVFPRSPEIGSRIRGLLELLAMVSLPGASSQEPRLADAVAVAGLFANRSARRRAVVLIATGDSPDASRFDPARVRRYLARVGVPLVVWSPEPGGGAVGEWGPAVDVSTGFRMDRAWAALGRELERQRVVWLSGLHLPQHIVLDTEGVEALR